MLNSRVLTVNFLATISIALLGIALALLIALSQPWLGLNPSVQNEQIISTQGRLLSLGTMALTPQDLMEEPDGLSTWSELTTFRSRQTALHHILSQPVVPIKVVKADSSPQMLHINPEKQRPIATLPASFWVQVTVALGAMLIGGWVWGMNPQPWSTRFFALSSTSIYVAILAAAVYSTREVALPGELFSVLSRLNQIGALGFGLAMMGLFLTYPTAVIAQRGRRVLGALFVVLCVLTGWQAWPAPTWFHYAIALEMLLILVFIGWQGWLSRGQPVQRASLTWLGLAVGLGAGIFVALNTYRVMTGSDLGLSQAHLFVSFLLIYIGIALGLTRYRLFDIGHWAFRVLFFMVGVMGLIALDALLAWGLSWSPTSAMGAALLVVGFMYLPLRDWAQRQIFKRPSREPHALFSAAMGVAFVPDQPSRRQRWQALLQSVFDPLEMMASDQVWQQVHIQNDGLTLQVPPTQDGPALTLQRPGAGRALFGPQDKKLVQELLQLLAQAHDNRQAYDQGVKAERLRVAQDLHDDIGSRLLTGIHSADDHLRPLLQETLADVRSIAKGLSGQSLSLGLVLAELRHEIARRCEVAGLQLDWPVAQTAQLLRDAPPDLLSRPLDYRWTKALLSSVREVISNAIKHAQAKTIQVRYQHHLATGALQIHITDDGQGIAANASDELTGLGLASIQNRLKTLGGTAQWLTHDPHGTQVRITLPMP